MSHPDHPAAAAPFSEAELREFRTSDKGAGGAVSVLMTTIFLIGLLMYAVIAYLASL